MASRRSKRNRPSPPVGETVPSNEVEVMEAEDPLQTMLPGEQNKLLAKLNERFEACVKARVPIENQWYLNLAFYYGKQWVVSINTKTANGMGSNLYEPPAPRWRVRITANKVQPMIRNEMTKLTKEEMQYFVVPASTDTDDIAAARAAENITEYALVEADFNRKRRAATLWLCTTGIGILKTWYNENAKDHSGTPGKCQIDSINPFNFFVPSLQTEELEEQPYVIHAQAFETSYIKQKFGVEVTADARVSMGTLDQRVQNLVGIVGDDKNNQAYLKEMWIKPCQDWPMGAVIWFTTDKILKIYPGWPYIHEEYPFAKIDHIPVPGRFYGISIIEGLISLQKEYNKTRSQIVESKNRTSKPQLMATKGSIDPRKVTSEPGLIIEVNTGFPMPQPLPLQSLPPYVIQELDRTLKDMDDHAGQYEITKGRTPPGVEAASAIAYLQEENDTRLYHTVASMEEAVCKVGRHVLCLVDQYWDEERLIKVVSKNGTYEAKKFKGSDIRGNYDFRIEPGSMAPRSRAARQAFITELMKMGAIPAQQGLRYLQMSETNRLYQEMQLDARHAQRENDKMATMQPELSVDPGLQAALPQLLGINAPEAPVGPSLPQDPMAGAIQGMESPTGSPGGLPPFPTNPFDNHQVHRDEHASFMKTQEYEQLPPENKQLIMQHWQEHDFKLQEQFMAMNQTQQPQGPPQE